MKNIFETNNQFDTFNEIPSILEVGTKTDVEYLVSIIMPVYKHPDFFKLALKSAIEQDLNEPFEIIVVDDDVDGYPNGDSPNKAVVKQANSDKVKYYKNTQNLGLCGNWNRSIELASGKYVVFCHDDERLSPSALSTLYDLSKQLDDETAIFPNKNAEFLDGSTRLYPQHKKLFGFIPRKIMYKANLPYFLDRTLGNGAGAWLNKECLINLGGYDPIFYPCSDFVLGILYANKYGAYRTNYPIITSRQGENLSFECYDLFAPTMKKIREFLVPLIKAPNFILHYIINVKYRTSKISFAIAFGNKKISYAKEVNFLDRLVSKFYTYYIDLKKYKIF